MPHSGKNSVIIQKTFVPRTFGVNMNQVKDDRYLDRFLSGFCVQGEERSDAKKPHTPPKSRKTETTEGLKDGTRFTVEAMGDCLK